MAQLLRCQRSCRLWVRQQNLNARTAGGWVDNGSRKRVRGQTAVRAPKDHLEFNSENSRPSRAKTRAASARSSDTSPGEGMNIRSLVITLLCLWNYAPQHQLYTSCG